MGPRLVPPTREEYIDCTNLSYHSVGCCAVPTSEANPISAYMGLYVPACNVLLQELSPQQPSLEGPPGARVSTVTPASVRLLERVGAWAHLAPPTSAAFADMQVLALPLQISELKIGDS